MIRIPMIRTVMIRTLMIRTSLFFHLTIWMLSPPAGAGETVFVAGDVSKLTCRVVKVKGMATNRKKFPHGSLLTLEVRNRGDVTAEPVAFRLTVKRTADGKTPDPFVVPRFKGAVFGRAGRAVKPGGTVRYRVMVPLFLKGNSGLTAAVTHASFFEGEPVEKLDVKARGRKSGRWNVGPEFPADLTSFRVKNPLPHPVDVAFLGRVEDPIACRAIFQCRLGPGEDTLLEIRGVHFSSGGGFEGADVKGLELIDWSVVKDDGKDRARQLFADAYRKWRRWEKPEAVKGRYVCRARQVPAREATGIKAFDYRSRGTFTLSADGTVQVTPETGGPQAIGSVRKAVLGAFADLRRPSVDKVLADNKLTLVEMGERPRLGISGPRWKRGGQPDGVIELVDGRIAGEGFLNSAMRTRWLTSTNGDGWVVGGRDAYQPLTGDTPWESIRVTYDETGGLTAPASYLRRQYLKGVSTQHVSITFSEIRRTDHAAAAPVVDTGPAAAAVRAAWEACYRYPDSPVQLSGTFVARNEGRTEALWQGEKRVSGTFEIQGWTGSRYSAHRVHVQEKLPELERRELGEVVMDRFRIWFFRDFAARKSFERTFAGATFTKRTNGVYSVSNGPYAAVEVKDGRVHALVYAGGTRRRFSYEKLGDHVVATGVKTGDEVCKARFQLVGDRLVPVDMHFAHVFGKDWGPESVTLKSVTVKP